jgi:hypothetical protein
MITSRRITPDTASTISVVVLMDAAAAEDAAAATVVAEVVDVTGMVSRQEEKNASVITKQAVQASCIFEITDRHESNCYSGN